MLRHTAGALAFLVLAALQAAPTSAQLKAGTLAPDFTAAAAQGGNVSNVNLRSTLAKGPVVLYFFPKSFTSGCTIEAHAFSDKIAEFRRFGATVIGVSADDIETQKKFSTQECRSSFLVASDPGMRIAREYDAVLLGAFTNRTSYVITSDGKVQEAYSNLEPLGHIEGALRTLRDLKTKTQ